MERLERARLGDRVLAREQELAFAADRVADVLELEPVRIRRPDLDLLDLTVAPQLDPRVLRMPRIVEEERALAADRLELVPLGRRGSAVEDSEHVAREAQRAREEPVRPGLADPGFPVHALGVPAGDEARAVDAVAADVHQCAALD